MPCGFGDFFTISLVSLIMYSIKVQSISVSICIIFIVYKWIQRKIWSQLSLKSARMASRHFIYDANVGQLFHFRNNYNLYLQSAGHISRTVVLPSVNQCSCFIVTVCKRNKAMNSVQSSKSYAYAELILTTRIHTLQWRFMGEINTTNTHPIKPVESPFRSSQSSSPCGATISSFEQDTHQDKFVVVWESLVVSSDILTL